MHIKLSSFLEQSWTASACANVLDVLWQFDDKRTITQFIVWFTWAIQFGPRKKKKQQKKQTQTSRIGVKNKCKKNKQTYNSLHILKPNKDPRNSHPSKKKPLALEPEGQSVLLLPLLVAHPRRWKQQEYLCTNK